MNLKRLGAKLIERDDVKDTTGPGTGTIMLTAASLVLLTVGISSTAWWIAGRPDEEWPSWIEAGATVAAVGAAVVAGFYAARAFGLEFQREQRWEDQQLSEQASLIAGWPVGAFHSLQDGKQVISGAEAMLRNASQLPARGVRVLFIVRYDDPNSDFGRTELLGEATLEYLPPGNDPTRVGYYSHIPPDGKVLPAPTGSETVELFIESFFRDSAGNDWYRDISGRLRPRSEYGLPSY